jgi:serine/threonine-protein kinase HipA
VVVSEELAVWLYGDNVAAIDQTRGRLRLTYTEVALKRYPLGTPLLSLSLPVQPERHTQGVVRPFLDGLLPEGQSRLAVADDFDVLPSDTFGLIREIGRECAGAIVIQPAEDAPPSTPSTATAEPLTNEEIERLIQNLRTAPLGVDERVRLSLGGVQEKLLLTRLPDGRWGRPVDGTPTTHILKPEIVRYPHTVENEAFCMRLATHLGLNVAKVDTEVISSRKLLVVERFDRQVETDGAVRRIHQEDFCQATATGPRLKYEDDGGPSLARIARILAEVADPEATEHLLAATVVNALVGNGDAHAKNFSLLHERSGALRLSPLYDVLSTLYYGDDRLAMYIDNVRRSNRVTAKRIVNEAASWGMPRELAAKIVADLLERAPDAMNAAREETKELPADLFETVEQQRKLLGSET